MNNRFEYLGSFKVMIAMISFIQVSSVGIVNQFKPVFTFIKELEKRPSLENAILKIAVTDWSIRPM